MGHKSTSARGSECRQQGQNQSLQYRSRAMSAEQQPQNGSEESGGEEDIDESSLRAFRGKQSAQKETQQLQVLTHSSNEQHAHSGSTDRKKSSSLETSEPIITSLQVNSKIKVPKIESGNGESSGIVSKSAIHPRLESGVPVPRLGVERPKKRSLVLDPSGTLYYHWSMVVSFAFLYNFWSLSYRFAFREIDFDTVALWFTLDYSADFIYILDVVINFHTGYLEDGVLQRNSDKIGQHYRECTLFYLDCFCLLPLDILYLSIGFNSILRCTRTFTLVHYILVIFHWNACLFHMISKNKILDIDNLYKINDNRCDDILCQYLHAFYWSTLALTTIGDLPKPRTKGEYIYIIVELFFGLFLFASVLGHVANIVTNVSAARKEFQAKLDAVKTFMRMRRVSDELQNKVIRWFDYLWISQKSSDEERTVACLPDRLKAEIAIHVHLDTLKRVDIFQNTEAGFLCELVLRLKSVLFSPGDYVCRKNEVGHDMYIVSRGILEVVTNEGKTVVATLKAGSYFGEISVLNVGLAGNKRTASVRSVGYSDLFCLNKQDLWDVLKNYPNAEARIRARAEERLSKLDINQINATGAKNENRHHHSNRKYNSFASAKVHQHRRGCSSASCHKSQFKPSYSIQNAPIYYESREKCHHHYLNPRQSQSKHDNASEAHHHCSRSRAHASMHKFRFNGSNGISNGAGTIKANQDLNPSSVSYSKSFDHAGALRYDQPPNSQNSSSESSALERSQIRCSTERTDDQRSTQQEEMPEPPREPDSCRNQRLGSIVVMSNTGSESAQVETICKHGRRSLRNRSDCPSHHMPIRNSSSSINNTFVSSSRQLVTSGINEEQSCRRHDRNRHDVGDYDYFCDEERFLDHEGCKAAISSSTRHCLTESQPCRAGPQQQQQQHQCYSGESKIMDSATPRSATSYKFGGQSDSNRASPAGYWLPASHISQQARPIIQVPVLATPTPDGSYQMFQPFVTNSAQSISMGHLNVQSAAAAATTPSYLSQTPAVNQTGAQFLFVEAPSQFIRLSPTSQRGLSPQFVQEQAAVQRSLDAADQAANSQEGVELAECAQAESQITPLISNSESSLRGHSSGQSREVGGEVYCSSDYQVVGANQDVGSDGRGDGDAQLGRAESEMARDSANVQASD